MQDVLVAVGGLCAVQGFGALVTKVFWGDGFGLAGVLRAVHVPGWAMVSIGPFGVVLLVIAGVRQWRKNRRFRTIRAQSR